VSGDVATNRRARHKFQLLETMETGIELRGSEVKSLRDGKAQLNEAYAVIDGGEVWLRGAHIPPYLPASEQNHDPDRPRKLLMHRREIERLIGKTAERGLTLVPTRIYFKGSRAKVELALAKGKEGRDRRREIADRDMSREVERDFKQRLR
jgi:SsrA-binding protein